MEAGGEDGGLLRLSIGGHAAEDLDVAGPHLRDEDVTIGRGADQARILESAGEEFDFEAGQGLRPCILRAWDNVRTVARGLRGVRLREIVYRDLMDRSGLLIAEVNERTTVAGRTRKARAR